MNGRESIRLMIESLVEEGVEIEPLLVVETRLINLLNDAMDFRAANDLFPTIGAKGVAAKFGVTRQTAYNWHHKHRNRLKIVKKIAS